MNRRSRASATGAMSVVLLFAACGRREAPPAADPAGSASTPAAPAPRPPALSDAAYRCELRGEPLPQRLGRSETVKLRVTLRNTSPETWPVRRGSGGDLKVVKLAYHWGEGRKFPWLKEGERVELPGDFAPGQQAALEISITAPARPGVYELGIEPVYETVAWFSWKNGCALTGVVTVR